MKPLLPCLILLLATGCGGGDPGAPAAPAAAEPVTRRQSELLDKAQEVERQVREATERERGEIDRQTQ